MRVLVALVLLVIALTPSQAEAWGFAPHRFIMDRAIALLPPELRPFFERHRAMLVERAIDPDTWRTMGFEEESKNHFLDMDWEGFGKYPYEGLPRDYTAALARFGRDRLEDTGTLPWRVEEFHGNLRRAFESYPRNPFGDSNIILFAASLTHYTSDGMVPFHAVINYDGQLTSQNGIHSRFETTLFERYREQLTLAPAPMAPIVNPRDFMFERLLEGTQLTPAILKSDLEAIGSRELYDDAYFKAFFAASRPVLERRLNQAIAASAAMITGAWQAAGRPPVPLDPPQTPRRRRQP